MPRREFTPAVRAGALARAYYRCEVCGAKEQLELRHIGNRQDQSLWNCQVVSCSLPCPHPRRAAQSLWWGTRDSLARTGEVTHGRVASSVLLELRRSWPEPA